MGFGRRPIQRIIVLVVIFELTFIAMTESVPAELREFNHIEILRLNEVITFRQFVIKFILKIEDQVIIFKDLLIASLFSCMLQIILASEKNKLLFVVEVRHSRDRIIYEFISEELVSRTDVKIYIRDRCFVKDKRYDLIPIKPKSVQIRIR